MAEDFPIDLFKGSTNSTYDPHEIYTQSTNKHDHSHNVQVPITPQIHAQAMKLVNDPRIPKYTSIQSVIRDALHHRVEWWGSELTDQYDAEGMGFERVRVIRGAARDMRKAQREFIADTRTELNELAAEREWDALERACESLVDALEERTFSENQTADLRTMIDNARSAIRNNVR